MYTKIIFIIILILSISLNAFEKELNQANNLYKNKNKEEAKKYYKLAAEKGSAEAHFLLAYQYVVSKKEGIYHFSEAAKKGHEEALEYALEYLFFRGNDLLLDPRKALNIYNTAKDANPTLKIYDEENKINTLRLASEVPPLDGQKFIEKYNIDLKKNDHPYYIWELAEKASKGSFDNKSPLLVMQLIIKGGFVPAEIEIAVNEYYKNFINNELVEFSICNFVTSGAGMAYCSSKAEKENELKAKKDLNEIIKKYNIQDPDLLVQTYLKSIEWIELKVWNEEGHDGSGYVAWANNSLAEQRNSYLQLLKNILNGSFPALNYTFEEADKILNTEYKKIRKDLGDYDISGMRFSIEADDFKKVQIAWIKIRDINARLFTTLNPEKDEIYWKTFLTESRLNDYNDLKEIIESYK